MRLIDANALAETYCDIDKMFHSEPWDLEDILAFLNDASTIEAAPVVHGKWVDHMCRDWRCSECGGKIHKVRRVDGYCYDDKPKYCPDCGARMDGDGNA